MYDGGATVAVSTAVRPVHTITDGSADVGGTNGHADSGTDSHTERVANISSHSGADCRSNCHTDSIAHSSAFDVTHGVTYHSGTDVGTANDGT